jgi:aspartate/glutamate racemase
MALRENPRNIAVVVENPKVGAYIYQAVIERVNRLSGSTKGIQHPNVVIYSRKPRLNDAKAQLDHDSKTVFKLDSRVMFYPDMSLSGVDLDKSRVRVYKDAPDLVTLPAASAGNSVVSLDQLSKPDRKKIEDWAECIVGAALYKNKEHFSKNIHSNGHSDNGMIHPDGLIAIHGGMGPESGNGALMYLSDRFKGDIVLMSAAQTPNSAKDFIVDMQAKPPRSSHPNPEPFVTEDRKKLVSINPDVIWMACNTMHYFQEPLQNTAPDKTLHIIEAGLQKAPKFAKVLLLATNASVTSGIFKTALEHIGRTDIRLVYPEPAMQSKIDTAIEEHVLKGVDYPKAARLIEEVVQRYAPKLGNNGFVMSGCTEVQVALKQGGGNLWDNDKHKKAISSKIWKNFKQGKPDLIVMNLSQNKAAVFTDYEMPPLIEFPIVDNLKEAADRSVEMCNHAVSERRGGLSQKPPDISAPMSR